MVTTSDVFGSSSSDSQISSPYSSYTSPVASATGRLGRSGSGRVDSDPGLSMDPGRRFSMASTAKGYFCTKKS